MSLPTVLASPPVWWLWGNPSVLDSSAPPQNKGVAVVGQAKFMADRALQVLTIIDSDLADDIRADLTQPQPRLTPPFGMVGPVVDFEVPSPKTSTWSEAQHAVLTVGQLKAISAPFYKHIHAAVPTWIDRASANPELKGQLQLNGTKDAADASNFYPWTTATGDDANRAPVTIGQLKAVFSLRLETLDLDENGIADYDPDEDYDGDGISNGDEFDLGTNPILADTDSNEIEVYRINKTSVQQSLNPIRPSHPGANWIRFTGDWSPPPAAVLLSPTPTIPVGNVGTITASQLTFPDTLPAGTPSYSYRGADPIYVGMGVYGSYDVMIAGATMYDDDIPGVYSSSALERPRLWMKLPAGMQSENARKIPYLFVSESEDWLYIGNHQYGPPTPMTVFDSFVVEFEFEAGSRVSKPLDVETELTGGTPGTLTSCRYLLYPVDLDIVHPVTGELDDRKEDIDDGGYISVQRLEDPAIPTSDVTPQTKLLLHSIMPNAPESWKVRLKFDAGGRYKIYKDEARTQEVTSEQTEFPANEDTTLWFHGLKKSLSRGGESITLQVNTGGSWHDGDAVKCTIVQSEFLFQVKAFIPYAWTEAEEIIGPDAVANPMEGRVAKGDLHPGYGDRLVSPGFRNKYSTDSPRGTTVSYKDFENAPFRVCQTVIVTPYKELHATSDIQGERNLYTAPLSATFEKATSVNAAEMSLKMGFMSLSGTAIKTGKPPELHELYDHENRTNDRVAEVTIQGGGKDGAIPPVIGVLPVDLLAADIYWRLYLKVWCDSDPLKPTVEFGGKHDSYPAYEIIVIESDGNFKDIHRVSPAAGAMPGPSSLHDSNAINVGRTDTITK